MVAVVSIEEKRATYLNAQGEERARFTATPDWLFEYMPKLSRGIGWNLLSIILHHQRMCERNRPVAISLQQFCKESGNGKPAVLRGLKALADNGLLYEELEDPTHKDSAICYALMAEPGQGIVTEDDGSLWVNLLGGWYEVETKRQLNRERVSHTGGIKTLPPQKRGRGGNKTLPPRYQNVTTCGNETLPPPSSQASRKAARPIPIESIERKESISPSSAKKSGKVSHSQKRGKAQGASGSLWLSEEASNKAPAKRAAPPNPLYEVWKQHAPPDGLPQSQEEEKHICQGLNKLKQAELPDKPMLEELPDLMAEVMSWGDGYFPDPFLIVGKIGKIRYDIKKKRSGAARKPANQAPAGPDLSVLLKHAQPERVSGRAMIEKGDC